MFPFYIHQGTKDEKPPSTEQNQKSKEELHLQKESDQELEQTASDESLLKMESTPKQESDGQTDDELEVISQTNESQNERMPRFVLDVDDQGHEQEDGKDNGIIKHELTIVIQSKNGKLGHETEEEPGEHKTEVTFIEEPVDKELTNTVQSEVKESDQEQGATSKDLPEEAEVIHEQEQEPESRPSEKNKRTEDNKRAC